MSESTNVAEPDPGTADSETDTEFEDLGPEATDDLDGPTDVPGGEIEDDSGYLPDVSIFTHLDDDASGPLEQSSGSEGGLG